VRLKVLFFGMLKDITGLSAEEADFEAGADLSTVFARYAERFPRLRDYEQRATASSPRGTSPSPTATKWLSCPR